MSSQGMANPQGFCLGLHGIGGRASSGHVSKKQCVQSTCVHTVHVCAESVCVQDPCAQGPCMYRVCVCAGSMYVQDSCAQGPCVCRTRVHNVHACAEHCALAWPAHTMGLPGPTRPLPFVLVKELADPYLGIGGEV